MFLPDDYKAPQANSSYFKLQDGDNKVRVLSKPIIGWEDWDERIPVRFKMHQKPITPKDPKRPIKHFWTMIVWDYAESRIKIWHVTQASVLKALNTLIADPDWGSPFGYDIKINRSGKDMLTKYAVNPSPHKPITNEVIQAFEDKPIYLDALFDNGDPFADWGMKTAGCFDTVVAETPGVISPAQVKELLEYIGDDKEYLSTLTANLLKHFGCKGLAELPATKYEAILKSVKIHAKDRLDREMAQKIDETLPF